MRFSRGFWANRQVYSSRSCSLRRRRYLPRILTLVESDRVLIRSTVAGQISEAEAANRRAHLSRVSGHWNLVRISDEIVSRARRPFPVEPIRTLDALHLASALVVRAAEPELTMLSLDERVRDCTLALGLGLLPEQISTSL